MNIDFRICAKEVERVYCFADLHLDGGDRDDKTTDTVLSNVLPSLKEDCDYDRNPAVAFLGDVFDGPSNARSRDCFYTLLAAMLKAAPDTTVFVLQGNHETDKEMDAISHLSKQVVSVSRPTVFPITYPAIQVALAFAPWCPKQAWADEHVKGVTPDMTANEMTHLWVNAIQKELPNMDVVLLGHANLDGARIGNGQELSTRVSLSPSRLKQDGVKIGVFGHVHMPQDVSQDVVYVGSPLNQSYGEHELRKSYISLRLKNVLEFERRWYPVQQKLTARVQWNAGAFSPDKLLALPDSCDAKITVEYPPTDEKSVVENYVRAFCAQNLKCAWELDFRCVSDDADREPAYDVRAFLTVADEVSAALEGNELQTAAAQLAKELEVKP